jgi:hypothetical protein
MARARKAVRRARSVVQTISDRALKDTLDREFDDAVATRTLPSPDDHRGRQRYLASLRRRALARPDVSVEIVGDRQGALGHVMDLSSLLKGRISLQSLLTPVRLGDGLYDFYPPELPVKGLWNRQPFRTPFNHPREWPGNSTLLLTVPQVGAGRFYASASTLQVPSDRHAHAWCGTLLPVDPALHDAAHGPRDIVIWAEGTLTYDYALSAPPSPAWSVRPEAAKARVDVMARLLRFNRATGALMADPDAVLAYLAHRNIVAATLLPNGVTTSPPSSAKPSVGGPYAGWSSGPVSFAIDLPDGKSRKLDTDSTYQVAVLCSVSLDALAAGQGANAVVANVEVSALLSLRLVTLGVLPHDPKVTL